MNAAEIQRERSRLLDRLAELSEGSTTAGLVLDQVGAEVGLNRRQSKRAFLRLRDEGLVELAGAGPCIRITHAGLRAIESGGLPAVAHAVPTQINLMYVERMERSQVQQGTRDSVQVRHGQS